MLVNGILKCQKFTGPIKTNKKQMCGVFWKKTVMPASDYHTSENHSIYSLNVSTKF